MNEFNKLVEVYAPGFHGFHSARSFKKGDIVELPVGWQKNRGYFADWAQDVTHGEVWGHVIDRNIHMTGDVEVTLLDPQTREPLGQGLAFRPDELTLAESTLIERSIYKNPNVIVDSPGYTTNFFHFKNGEGSCYISDLPNFEWQKVYRDAEDVGITIKSPKTFNAIVFVVDEEDTDDEGDVAGWHLVSLGPNGRPDGRFKVLLIND